MSEELDTGFFEPFNGNITSCDTDGNVTAVMRSAIIFDKDIINSYFDDAQVEYKRENPTDVFTVTFKGRAKNEAIRNILMKMAFTVCIDFKFPKLGLSE